MLLTPIQDGFTGRLPGNYRKNIPLADLLEALHDHGIEYVRSDEAEKPPEGFSADANAKWIDLEIPC